LKKIIILSLFLILALFLITSCTRYPSGNAFYGGSKEVQPIPKCIGGTVKSGTECLVCNTNHFYAPDNSKCKNGKICSTSGVCTSALPPIACQPFSVKPGTQCLVCNSQGTLYIPNNSKCDPWDICSDLGLCVSNVIVQDHSNIEIKLISPHEPWQSFENRRLRYYQPFYGIFGNWWLNGTVKNADFVRYRYNRGGYDGGWNSDLHIFPMYPPGYQWWETSPYEKNDIFMGTNLVEVQGCNRTAIYPKVICSDVYFSVLDVVRCPSNSNSVDPELYC